MSHSIFETEAFVLNVFPRGEGNGAVRLFARDYGLLHTHVQGVRKLPSKLRAHLQPYSHGMISLVRGRDVWRVVGAESTDLLRGIALKPERFMSIARIFSVVTRYASHEHGDELLFDDVKKGIEHLVSKTDDQNPDLELLIVARILSRLGYLETTVPETDHVPQSERSTLLREVNRALRESHM